MNELTIEAVIENIPAVTEYVDGKLESMGCPMKAQMQIDVAIDELFSNIAKFFTSFGKILTGGLI